MDESETTMYQRQGIIDRENNDNISTSKTRKEGAGEQIPGIPSNQMDHFKDFNHPERTILSLLNLFSNTKH